MTMGLKKFNSKKLYRLIDPKTYFHFQSKTSSNFSLIKEETQRPKYNRLLEHPFIKGIDQSRSDVAEYVCKILDAMERNGVSPFTTDQPAQAWVD